MEEAKQIPDEDTYIQAQIRAVLALRACGIGYKLNDRIEPFKCYLKLGRCKMPKVLVDNAKGALVTLVKLRQMGLEPPHVGA